MKVGADAEIRAAIRIRAEPPGERSETGGADWFGARGLGLIPLALVVIEEEPARSGIGA
jgi:hypothetical protein